MRPSVYCGLFILISAVHCSAANIIFTTNAYPPYVINQHGRASGIFPKIIRAIFQGTQDHIEINFRPWPRAERLVRQGRAYATFPYVSTPSRASSFDFSQPVIRFFPRFFYLKSSFPEGFHWNSLSDFRPYRVGGVLGYWYQSLFKAAGVRVDYVRTDRMNMEKLFRHRIDFTLVDTLVGWTLIRQLYPHRLQDFAVTAKAQSSGSLRLMVSRNYPDAKRLTARFNAGLARIRRNGVYQKIFEQYHVPNAYMTQ